jgi:hypothetical protein
VATDRKSPGEWEDLAATAGRVGNYSEAASLYRKASGACIGHGRGERCDELARQFDAKRVACSKCGESSDTVQSTFCGSLCGGCLAAHCEVCGVCNRDFGNDSSD